jgi:3-hydroxymyristoyl/3-hydroxydecanoyl-(acyl carrier protein) dehydratase
MERLGSKYGRGHGIATVDGDVACDAKLAFIIAPASALS